MSASNTVFVSSAYPYDTVVRITDQIGGTIYQASGVLIAPNEVLTASHVVWQQGIGTATNIVVAPAYVSGNTPYGTAQGVSFHYNAVNDTNDIIPLADSQSDFAVIHLATSFSVGTMALGANYPGGSVQVTGYPASSLGVMVDSTQIVTQDPIYSLLDGIDIGAGSSGGPVWITGANGQPTVVGLVSSGSGRRGFFVQLTSADDTAINVWVAADNAAAATGTPAPTTGVTPPAPSLGTAETVYGAGLGVVTLTVPNELASLESPLLVFISGQVAASALVGINATAGASPAAPAGTLGELVIGGAGSYAVPAGFAAVVNRATANVAITDSGDANQTVVSGIGGLIFAASGQAGGTLAADGNSLVYAAQDSGGWNITLAAGANTIVGGPGALTVRAGAGGNLMFLGSGASSVLSSGTDTILGGTGSATISASANPDLVFGGSGPLTFQAGSAASTVVAGAGVVIGGGGATLQGGVGASLFFGAGQSSYVGAGAADTVVGGAGTLTGTGDGSSLIFGGNQGGNRLVATGADTLIGAGPILGGTADTLSATGSAGAVIAAGAGHQTLIDASLSTGANVLFAGGGNDTLLGGAGNDALVAGSGNGTLSAGGGTNLFEFVAGHTGAVQVVTDFDASRDFVNLAGYAPGAAASAVQAAIVVQDGTAIFLGDGTEIFFLGIAGLQMSSFV